MGEYKEDKRKQQQKERKYIEDARADLCEMVDEITQIWDLKSEQTVQMKKDIEVTPGAFLPLTAVWLEEAKLFGIIKPLMPGATTQRTLPGLDDETEKNLRLLESKKSDRHRNDALAGIAATKRLERQIIEKACQAMRFQDEYDQISQLIIQEGEQHFMINCKGSVNILNRALASREQAEELEREIHVSCGHLEIFMAMSLRLLQAVDEKLFESYRRGEISFILNPENEELKIIQRLPQQEKTPREKAIAANKT